MVDQESSRLEQVLQKLQTHQQNEYQLKNVEDGARVLELGAPVDTISLLRETDVLIYGESHDNYAIPDHLLEQVPAFKTSGVTSFGFEINPDPKLQTIFDELNSGNVTRANEIDWSLGWGNQTVRETKQKLVETLVKEGIRVYPFASWEKDNGVEGKPYTREVEQDAALRIVGETKDGKTVVLVGRKHGEYGEGRKAIQFPHTADSVKALGKKVKSVAIDGGMQSPGAYDKDPQVLISTASLKINLKIALHIDTAQRKIEGHHNDGILVLPEVPTLTRNMPVPIERKQIGGFTPLENVVPSQAIQSARATIAQQR